jgi:adenylosuccinate lyase
MIPRYSREPMASVWTDESKYSTWLEVEQAAARAMARHGLVPQEAADAISNDARFDVARILEIEETVKHDVIAFTTCVAEHLGAHARYFHFGMTSSDVLDTAFACQLKKAGEILLDSVDALVETTKSLADTHKTTLMIGRSHGIHGEPTTFGLKALGWHCEFSRQRRRLKAAIHDISVGIVSGAVGTFAHLPLAIEEEVCKDLGLRPDPVSTQVVSRDRHAQYFGVLAGIAGTMERIAVEIRHLQRTEVSEAEEAFTKGQKGSSAMPHKRNPIASENLTGVARLMRGYAQSAAENVALWHERDISHSSVERVIGPDANIALHYGLTRLNGLLKNLVVYPKRMRANVDLTEGRIFSGNLMLKLVAAGVSREDAYTWTQRCAMASFEGKGTFVDLVKNDSDITSTLDAGTIESVLDPESYLKNVPALFKRVENSTL